MIKSSDGGFLSVIKRKMGLFQSVPAPAPAPGPAPAPAPAPVAAKASPPYPVKIVYSHTVDLAKEDAALAEFAKQMSS